MVDWGTILLIKINKQYDNYDIEAVKHTFMSSKNLSSQNNW